MKDFQNLYADIDEMVSDVIKTNLNFNDSQHVPNIEDNDLTFERDEEKKGVHIKTCVLYVDVRDSVRLTNEHTIEKMGKVFTAFTKAVLMIAWHCKGFVRNIIGDRVMVIFPEENCFQNAIDCAISINHIATSIITNKIYGIEFRCGIGIDYGDMYCIKVGLPKRGQEREDNRRLIWLGLPANNASRLTDQANKEYNTARYKIEALVRRIIPKRSENYFLPIPQSPYVYVDKELPAEDIVEDVLQNKIRHANIKEKHENAGTYPPILVSESVFDGFKKQCPDYNSIKNNWWIKQNAKIRDIKEDIYGANLHWKI